VGLALQTVFLSQQELAIFGLNLADRASIVTVVIVPIIIVAISPDSIAHFFLLALV